MKKKYINNIFNNFGKIYMKTVKYNLSKYKIYQQQIKLQLYQTLTYKLSIN